MKGEINRDWYCSAGYEICGGDYNVLQTCKVCPGYHRKHPTPEQYREEYGSELTKTTPVWFHNSFDWELTEYGEYIQLMIDIQRIDKDFGCILRLK